MRTVIRLFTSPWQVVFSRCSNTKELLIMPYVVCGLAAFFYLFEYVLQVSPSVMTNELMRDLNINAVGLSTMAAFYFYAYSPMQLPGGLLYDRYGPRRMITVALIFCSCGALFFGLAPNLMLASLGRFLIGVGSAFSFVGVLVLLSRWFPAHYFAFLAGIAQLMSSVGAMIGKVPLAYWVAQIGWRGVMIGLGIMGFALAILIWSVIRDFPAKDRHQYQQKPEKSVARGEIKRLASVCKKRQTWVIALYACAIWSPIAVFATLWDVPYLVARYPGTSIATASGMASMVWLGIGVGSPFLGWWSDHIGRRCLPLSLSAALGVFSALIILYVPNIPFAAMYPLMFLFGAAASGQATCFSVVKDINKPTVVGTAMGLNNMSVLMGGAIFPPIVGHLIQSFWDGRMQNGASVYAAATYQKALFILPLCFVVAWIMSAFFMRETHCQAYYSDEEEAVVGA